MKKSLVVVLLFAGLALCTSKDVYAQSEAAVLYLMIKPGAGPAGAGEAFVATADDATATWYNPAGLAFQSERQVSLMHTNWLPAFASDLYYEFFAYSQYVEGWGNLGVHLAFMSYGKQVRTGQTGDVLGEFQSYDAALGLSYGATLSDLSAAGVTMKIIYSHLSDQGTGAEKGSGSGMSYAIDLGFLKKQFLLKKLSLGLTLQNMGPAIAYIDADQADPLPQNIKLGFAYDILNSEYSKLKFSMDFSKLLVRRQEETADPFYEALFTAWFDNPIRQEIDEVIENVGLEYWYGSLVALRCGFFRDTYFSTGNGDPVVTFGAGLKYRSLKFDFAYVPAPDTPLADNTRVSLTIGF